MQNQWTLKQAAEIFALPFNQLLYQAQSVHREHFDPRLVQVSTLLNIKTGGCSENCAYCAQSARAETGLKKEPLMSLSEIVQAAAIALDNGATRFCMGAAWRGPLDSDLTAVCEMIAEVKKLGLEACVTLGLLKGDQAKKLKAAGLDFYNHNVDTAAEYYEKVTTTHTFQERLDTLKLVREAGIKICCGGILGLGEKNEDRIKMLVLLANLGPPPESVPINRLVKIPGTRLAESEEEVDPFDLVRVIALARIMLPSSYVRLAAGREKMSDELQALCFMAGVNSIFYGEQLLTTNNRAPTKDNLLFKRLGLQKQ